MNDQPTPILYHQPHSRSTMSVCMLEEVGVPYEKRLMNLVEGDQKKPEYHALNAMEKVPTLLHGDAVVCETGAVLSYLADAYPQAGLAPPPGAGKARAAYLRWLFFGGNCFEPAGMDVFSPRKEPLHPGQAGWGDLERVLGAVREAVAEGPFLLGEAFSAADVLIGNQAGFFMQWGTVDAEKEPEIAAYVARCEAREAWKRVRAEEAKHVNPWAQS